MNWEDAEMKLKVAADGSFLVRDSSDPRYILSLSFRSQGVTHHTRMEHYQGDTHTHTLTHLWTDCGRHFVLKVAKVQSPGPGLFLMSRPSLKVQV